MFTLFLFWIDLRLDYTLFDCKTFGFTLFVPLKFVPFYVFYFCRLFGLFCMFVCCSIIGLFSVFSCWRTVELPAVEFPVVLFAVTGCSFFEFTKECECVWHMCGVIIILFYFIGFPPAPVITHSLSSNVFTNLFI